MIKERFPLVLCHKITTKTTIGFITNSLYQQNWGKRGTSENSISPSQSQFQLSRNAASNSLLIWRTTGKLLLLDLVLRKPNFLLLDEPTRNFSPTSQPQIRKLFATYPGGLITVSHDRRFLKRSLLDHLSHDRTRFEAS